MLTRKEALYYNEQLHPAFASYLFNGTITQRDCLATIFHLLTKGMLEPIWKDGSMQKSIIGVRKVRTTSNLEFNQVVINKIFGSNTELSIKEIGTMIKNGVVKDIIEKNLNVIATFQIINEELKFTLGKHGTVNFSVNGNKVDTIEETTAFKRLLYRLLLPLFLGIGALIIGLSFLFNHIAPSGQDFAYNNQNVSVNIQGGSGSGMLLTGGILIFSIAIILFSFIFSKKTLTYDFKNKIEPIAKKKYKKLYEFIKSYPLPKHRFTNEFLAFSIAFGLDDSWNTDFGLEKEVQIDSTPMTS